MSEIESEKKMSSGSERGRDGGGESGVKEGRELKEADLGRYGIDFTRFGSLRE